MLGYVCLLVKRGLFKEVQLSYLPVGHTHEDADAALQDLSGHYTRADVLSYYDYWNSFLKGIVLFTVLYSF